MPAKDLDISREFHPALIVPRYGPEVMGGAEDLALRLCEELAQRSVQVSVLTTCAVDHYTWANFYPPGESKEKGVRVIRFPAETRLGDPKFVRVIQRIARGEKVTEKEQLGWLRGVIYSEELIQHLHTEAGEYTHLIFLPYLFGPTYFGSKVRPEASYIIPCLHDEPYARLNLIQEMLRSVKGLMFNSAAERDLACNLLGESNPGEVVGVGFETRPHDARQFFARHPVRPPFVLYAGRRESGKNTPLLVDYFQHFLEEDDTHSSLVLAGVGEVDIPSIRRNRIFDVGRLREKTKWDAYDAATVFCQPSVNESLSIVLLESWLTGTPALVNSECAVTRDHVLRSGGGLCFRDYDEFAEALQWMLSHKEESEQVGALGRRYVQEQYGWNSVIKRLLHALGERADSP